MTRSCTLLTLSTLLTLTACPGGSSKDYACERAAGSPTDRGYLGEVGADGCEAGFTCASEPGEGGGDCLEETVAQCVLDGLGEGAGVSKDCAEDEVCVVGAGAWYGLCEGWAEQGEEISGAVSCDSSAAEPLSVQQGEVMSFNLTFDVPEDDTISVTAGADFLDADGTLIHNGNPLGLSSYVLEDPVSLDLTWSWQDDAELSWSFWALECNTVPFTASYARHTGPVTHIDTAAAMPLAQGEAASAVLGCHYEGGDGATRHVAHLYALEAAAGDVLSLSLSVEGFDGDTAALTTVTLLDASGAEVIESGNPVTIDTWASPTPSRDVTVPEAGLYYLSVDAAASECAPTRYAVGH